MIVLTVVTAPRPLRVGLRPSKGGSAGQGLPNLYPGAELPRGSVRAVARTSPGWVRCFGSRRLEARRATVSDSVYGDAFSGAIECGNQSRQMWTSSKRARRRAGQSRTRKKPPFSMRPRRAVAGASIPSSCGNDRKHCAYEINPTEPMHRWKVAWESAQQGRKGVLPLPRPTPHVSENQS